MIYTKDQAPKLAPRSLERCTKPKFPEREEDFAFFLAGLVDSDGHLSKIPQLVICFHKNDINVAYFIKSFIGHGSVKIDKNRTFGRYVLAHRLGLMKIATLLWNKLQHPNKKLQFNQRLIPALRLKATPLWRLPLSDGHAVLENELSQPKLNAYWLAGFIQGDGSFQIKILDRKSFADKASSRTEVRIVLQVDQKEDSILKYLQSHLDGYIGFRKSQNTYYYSTVSFVNARKVIEHLNDAHLVGSKMTQYVLWRRAYLLVQCGKHRTEHGILTLRAIQKRLQHLKK